MGTTNAFVDSTHAFVVSTNACVATLAQHVAKYALCKQWFLLTNGFFSVHKLNSSTLFYSQTHRYSTSLDLFTVLVGQKLTKHSQNGVIFTIISCWETTWCCVLDPCCVWPPLTGVIRDLAQQFCTPCLLINYSVSSLPAAFLIFSHPQRRALRQTHWGT